MKNNPPIYDLYCRKSQEDEDRQVLSLEAQEKECKEYASKNGIKIRKIWMESFSAKAPGRKLFNEMMESVANGLIDGILAWNPDRLSRNSVDGGLIIYYIDQNLLKNLVFPTYHFENTPQGKWMLNIQFGQSKYYIDQLSVNVKRGNKLKIEKGWRPNMAPAGYLNDRINKTTIVDPDRFPILQSVVRDIVEGKLLVNDALDKLNNKYSYKSLKLRKSGGRPLSRASIYNLLKNPFYCEIITLNGKEYQGKHESMITLDEYDRLQVMLGKKGNPRKQSHDFPLTGAIRCAECGSMITAQTRVKYHPKTGERIEYTYYRCTKKNLKIKCNQSYISSDELELQVDSYLSKITIAKEFKDWALKYLDFVNEHEAHTEKTSYENIHKQVEHKVGLR